MILMKKILLGTALVCTFLTGCNNQTKVSDESATAIASTNQSVSTTPSPSAQQMPNAEEEVRKRASDFYELIKEQDKVHLADYISNNQLERDKLTKEQAVENLFHNQSGDNLEIKGYEIKQFTKYDDNHFYVIFRKRVVLKGQEASGEEEWMVVNEGGSWKMDNTLIAKSSPLSPLPRKNYYLSAINLLLNERMNGYSVEVNLINANEGNDLIFGTNKAFAKATLVTTEGAFSKSFDDKMVLPVNGNMQTTIPFADAKGVPLCLVFDELYAAYNVDDKGYPKPDGGELSSEAFYFTDMTEDRMKKIGSDLFTILAKIDASQNEKEADEVLAKTIGNSESPLAKSIKKNMEYGKYKRVDATLVGELANYDSSARNIQYSTSINYKLVDQDGKETADTYRVKASIGVNPESGTFYIQQIEFK